MKVKDLLDGLNVKKVMKSIFIHSNIQFNNRELYSDFMAF